MERAIQDHPDFDPAKGSWRRKHPPEMVMVNDKMEPIMVWIEQAQSDEEFANTKEELVSAIDEMPDDAVTRTLFAMIQAYLTATSSIPDP